MENLDAFLGKEIPGKILMAGYDFLAVAFQNYEAHVDLCHRDRGSLLRFRGLAWRNLVVDIVDALFHFGGGHFLGTDISDCFSHGFTFCPEKLKMTVIDFLEMIGWLLQNNYLRCVISRRLQTRPKFRDVPCVNFNEDAKADKDSHEEYVQDIRDGQLFYQFRDFSVDCEDTTLPVVPGKGGLGLNVNTKFKTENFQYFDATLNLVEVIAMLSVGNPYHFGSPKKEVLDSMPREEQRIMKVARMFSTLKNTQKSDVQERKAECLAAWKLFSAKIQDSYHDYTISNNNRKPKGMGNKKKGNSKKTPRSKTRKSGKFEKEAVGGGAGSFVLDQASVARVSGSGRRSSRKSPRTPLSEEDSSGEHALGVDAQQLNIDFTEDQSQIDLYQVPDAMEFNAMQGDVIRTPHQPPGRKSPTPCGTGTPGRVDQIDEVVKYLDTSNLRLSKLYENSFRGNDAILQPTDAEKILSRSFQIIFRVAAISNLVNGHGRIDPEYLETQIENLGDWVEDQQEKALQWTQGMTESFISSYFKWKWPVRGKRKEELVKILGLIREDGKPCYEVKDESGEESAKELEESAPVVDLGTQFDGEKSLAVGDAHDQAAPVLHDDGAAAVQRKKDSHVDDVSTTPGGPPPASAPTLAPGGGNPSIAKDGVSSEPSTVKGVADEVVGGEAVPAVAAYPGPGKDVDATKRLVADSVAVAGNSVEGVADKVVGGEAVPAVAADPGPGKDVDATKRHCADTAAAPRDSEREESGSATAVPKDFSMPKGGTSSTPAVVGKEKIAVKETALSGKYPVDTRAYTGTQITNAAAAAIGDVAGITVGCVSSLIDAAAATNVSGLGGVKGSSAAATTDLSLPTPAVVEDKMKPENVEDMDEDLADGNPANQTRKRKQTHVESEVKKKSKRSTGDFEWHFGGGGRLG